MPAALVGLIGAFIVAYGVSQPWISTFQGLITQSGWSTRNGDILLAGALAAGLLAVVSALWDNSTVRWLLAQVGFGTVAYAGYLLIQLYTVTQTSDSMIFLGRGPGLYIATAGAAVVFSTIFLPMPAGTTSEAVSDATTDWDAPDVDTVASTGRASALFTAIASPLRFPAALLAIVAGLAHVPVTPEHLNEAPYIGISFMVLTTVCVVLAATMLVWDSAVVWATLGAVCLLAVAAYAVSRTVGLPLMADDVGNWMERLGVISVLTESGVVLLAVAALARARGSRRRA
jgi:hypothetical protein